MFSFRALFCPQPQDASLYYVTLSTTHKRQHERRDDEMSSDLKTMATTAVNKGLEHLHKVHDLMEPNMALALVVGGMAIIGVMKAAGKMPHPASKMIGRGEFIGAMFMVLPRVVMKGFGRVTGCCTIFAVMGAMMAIKPKAFVTEALFITLASKVMSIEWDIVPHKDITSKVQWEAVMAFFIIHGIVLGLGVRIFAAGGGPEGPVPVQTTGAGGKKGDTKKRTKRA